MSPPVHLRGDREGLPVERFGAGVVAQRWDEASANLREAHAVYSRTIGADHLWTHFVEAALAAGYVARGQRALGQPYLDRFYQYRAASPPDPSNPAAAQDLTNQIDAFALILEDLDLDREAEWFRALIDRPEAVDGER